MSSVIFAHIRKLYFIITNDIASISRSYITITNAIALHPYVITNAISGSYITIHLSY